MKSLITTRTTYAGGRQLCGRGETPQQRQPNVVVISQQNPKTTMLHEVSNCGQCEFKRQAVRELPSILSPKAIVDVYSNKVDLFSLDAPEQRVDTLTSSTGICLSKVKQLSTM